MSQTDQSQSGFTVRFELDKSKLVEEFSEVRRIISETFRTPTVIGDQPAPSGAPTQPTTPTDDRANIYITGMAPGSVEATRMGADNVFINVKPGVIDSDETQERGGGLSETDVRRIFTEMGGGGLGRGLGRTPNIRYDSPERSTDTLRWLEDMAGLQQGSMYAIDLFGRGDPNLGERTFGKLLDDALQNIRGQLIGRPEEESITELERVNHSTAKLMKDLVQAFGSPKGLTAKDPDRFEGQGLETAITESVFNAFNVGTGTGEGRIHEAIKLSALKILQQHGKIPEGADLSQYMEVRTGAEPRRPFDVMVESLTTKGTLGLPGGSLPALQVIGTEAKSGQLGISKIRGQLIPQGIAAIKTWFRRTRQDLGYGIDELPTSEEVKWNVVARSFAQGAFTNESVVRDWERSFIGMITELQQEGHINPDIHPRQFFLSLGQSMQQPVEFFKQIAWGKYMPENLLSNTGQYTVEETERLFTRRMTGQEGDPRYSAGYNPNLRKLSDFFPPPISTARTRTRQTTLPQFFLPSPTRGSRENITRPELPVYDMGKSTIVRNAHIFYTNNRNNFNIFTAQGMDIAERSISGYVESILQIPNSVAINPIREYLRKQSEGTQADFDIWFENTTGTKTDTPFEISDLRGIERTISPTYPSTTRTDEGFITRPESRPEPVIYTDKEIRDQIERDEKYQHSRVMKSARERSLLGHNISRLRDVSREQIASQRPSETPFHGEWWMNWLIESPEVLGLFEKEDISYVIELLDLPKIPEESKGNMINRITEEAYRPVVPNLYGQFEKGMSGIAFQAALLDAGGGGEAGQSRARDFFMLGTQRGGFLRENPEALDMLLRLQDIGEPTRLSKMRGGSLSSAMAMQQDMSSYLDILRGKRGQRAVTSVSLEKGQSMGSIVASWRAILEKDDPTRTLDEITKLETDIFSQVTDYPEEKLYDVVADIKQRHIDRIVRSDDPARSAGMIAHEIRADMVFQAFKGSPAGLLKYFGKLMDSETKRGPITEDDQLFYGLASTYDDLNKVFKSFILEMEERKDSILDDVFGNEKQLYDKELNINVASHVPVWYNLGSGI